MNEPDPEGPSEEQIEQESSKPAVKAAELRPAEVAQLVKERDALREQLAEAQSRGTGGQRLPKGKVVPGWWKARFGDKECPTVHLVDIGKDGTPPLVPPTRAQLPPGVKLPADGQ